MLSEQLQKQIEQEAAQAASMQFHPKWSPDQNTACRITYRQGATEYAEKWQEAQQLIERYEKALKFILKWEFPPTGQFWDVDKLQPMSYAACYGSNGERDFMRNIANEALTPKAGSDERRL